MLNVPQAATKNCNDAKDEAMYVLSRVILKDQQLVEICENFSRPRRPGVSIASETTPRLETTPSTTSIAGEEGSGMWSGSGSSSDRAFPTVDASAVVEFFLDVVSSVTMLPPLDQDATYPDAVEIIGAGMRQDDQEHADLVGGEIILGPEVPNPVVMAIGKYCASNRHIAQMYPSVSTIVLKAWDKGKSFCK